MKRKIWMLCGCMISFIGAYSQDNNWFAKKVQIGQSMETSEQTQLPAQFLIIFPQNKSASYLVDFGASIGINSHSWKEHSRSWMLISKATVEYHLNSMADSAQNNLQIGYTGTLVFPHVDVDKFILFLIFDPKFVHDQIGLKNSIATNLLFTFSQASWKTAWNTNNFYRNNTRALFLSAFAGAQVQDVLNGNVPQSAGLILRPLGTLNAAYSFLKTNDFTAPIVKLQVLYTGRYDVVNGTNQTEGFTHLFKAGADFYIVNKPVKLSLGYSFVTGSDPLQGLAQQQYSLFSVNFGKTLP